MSSLWSLTVCSACDFSIAWTAATLNKGTRQEGVVDSALASGPWGAIHPISIDVAFLVILMEKWKGCNSCSGFLVQLGYSCPNQTWKPLFWIYLHVSMVGTRPTIVLLPFSWAIGAFHPLGRLGLGLEVEAEGSSSSESDSTELELSLSSSVSWAPWPPSVSDGLESDEEQSKSSLDIAGLPFNTGLGQYKLYTVFKYYGNEKNLGQHPIYSLHSKLWLPCHPLAADNDFCAASPLSWKKNVCKQN